ncbi:MAG TPA: hypothetical protein VIX14_15540 [Terriglobales bacterium]
MNWNTLLHWMTHMVEGSWDAFKDAVTRLASQDEALDELFVRLRLHLSDMGQADFFVAGSRRWRVLPPVLAGLAGRPEVAVLCGGRTPQLSDTLTASAEAAGCSVSFEEASDAPANIWVTGEPAALANAAAKAGVRYVSDYAGGLCREVEPLYELFERAPEESAPTNWSRKSFDFNSMSMVEGFRPNSACECSPRRGLARWYVHTRRGRLRAMPKREAIYAAAMLQRVTLLRYDIESNRLLCPARVPPPELFARVACLCAGKRGRVEDRMIVFDRVPLETAAVLCVAAGQPRPGTAPPDIYTSKTGNYHGQPV